MTDLIRQTVGWTDAAWPPNYYALLGLTPGPVEPDHVEAAVLDRMEKLRVFQLVQPDAVTEGMNLLARALVTLSDPAAKAEYDRGLGVGLGVGEATESRSGRVEENGSGGAGEQLSAGVVEGGNDEAVGDSVLSLLPTVEEKVDREPVVRPPTELERTISQDRSIITPPSSRGKKPSRKKGSATDVVRWVVHLRRLLAAWDDAGEWLAIPELTFATRREAVEVILALRCISRLAPAVVNVTGPGAVVLKLAHSDPLSSTLIDISDSQRQSLARDWRAGRSTIRDEYRRTRGQMNRQRRRLRIRPPWQRTLATWGLWFFGITAALIIVVRFWRE